ncbi:MAG: beta-ketoacyl-ACP synthase II [Planctomycetes bacterium]|jgi:3-oxoacyl-[acyl-carrier-protein] synthase II|nr:beta-ketoacyl-ACP synthase II [Phycisphaerae bacterium]NBB95464.1 beta-ketoacyl-ACP synthase II [Planctomycetota bacterium]
MATRRVVITGLGTVNPLAHSVADTWAALMDGTSGIAPITKFDISDFTSQIGGEVKAWAIPDGTVEHREAKRMDPVSQYAVVSAIEAVRQSGLDFEKEDRSRCGVIVGSGIGGLLELETQHERMMAGGPRKVSPFTVPKLMGNASGGHIGIYYGLSGPNFSIATACASAAHSIGEAARIIQRGRIDVAITGGTEAALTKIGLASFCALKGLSTRNDDPTHASRPWDADRDGFLLAEGAGVVVLETLEHAQARGATILAELVGFGSTCDAHHITAPEPEGIGAAAAMTEALADAALAPEDVDYINAHGTSTVLGDIAEVNAIKKVFGEHATSRKLVVSSTKSQTGHLLGASAGVELIACVKTINECVIPATQNLDHPGEDCDLDCVPNEPREAKIDVALSNSFGFGGHNGCLMVKRFNG